MYVLDSTLVQNIGFERLSLQKMVNGKKRLSIQYSKTFKSFLNVLGLFKIVCFSGSSFIGFDPIS